MSLSIRFDSQQQIREMMRNTALKTLALGCLLGASAVASAFTPVGGLWGFTNELNGQPGRGFQLTVENDVLVFYYYGYDNDGSGNYMFASGPLVNGSVFTGQLLTCRGGTVMGAAYKAATCSDGPGKVTMTFASGEKGTITLPGEAPKAINRFNFGYADGPDALLGEFLFAYKGTTTSFSEFYTVTKKTGEKSDFGNGLGTGRVTNAANSFACEYAEVADVWKQVYVCTELSGSQYDDVYVFRMVGDRGTGVGTWYGSSTVYPLQVLRVATRTLTRTGAYDEVGPPMMKPKSVAEGDAEVAVDFSMEAKELERGESGVAPLLTKEEQAYFVARAATLRAAARSHSVVK